MVVLKPTLEGERTKTCRCGHTGLASPVPERSSFYPLRSSERAGSFISRCRRCLAEEEKGRSIGDPGRLAARRSYARRQAAKTEEEREEQRRKWREAKRRRLELDPKRTKMRNAEIRKNYLRRKDQRIGHKAMLEERRIRDLDRRVRQGKAKLPALSSVMAKNATFGEPLPIAPFRAWVEEVISSSRENEKRAPEFFGITARRLQSWRYEYDVVDYAVVDRAASRHGGTTVDEIYRNGGMIIKTLDDGSFAFVIYLWSPEKEGEGRVDAVQTTEKTRSCRSPGCEEDSGAERFCDFHVKLFARVKESIEGDSARFKATIKRKGARPTCCNPACRAPRLASERYCDACAEAGWDEGSIE